MDAPTQKITCPECGMEFATQEEHDKHHAETHGHDQNTETQDEENLPVQEE